MHECVHVACKYWRMRWLLDSDSGPAMEHANMKDPTCFLFLLFSYRETTSHIEARLANQTQQPQQTVAMATALKIHSLIVFFFKLCCIVKAISNIPYHNILTTKMCYNKPKQF